MLNDLDFDDLDKYLLSQNGKIIHQVWFTTITSRRETKKNYDSLKKCRDSWKINNPTWCHVQWDRNMSLLLVKNCYPEHMNLFKSYPYEIQRCDVIRYFFLYRYGGLYADMDYYCNRPFDEALKEYKNDIYFVQTPNGIDSDHVSNSLMYSKPNHNFWKYMFIQLEKYKICPIYYPRHLTIMFTTGPSLLNRSYKEGKYKYKLGSFPSKYFHPHGINDDITSLKGKDIFAIHLGKGSWESNDSKLFLFFIKEWKIMVFILVVLLIPFLRYFFSA